MSPESKSNQLFSIYPTDFNLVYKFHEAFDLPRPAELTVLDRDRENLRNGFTVEEFGERLEALGYAKDVVDKLNEWWEWAKTQPKEREVDLVALADALQDEKYFILGTEIEYGIPGDDCFEEVHNSNMSKLDDDGKPIINDGILDPSKPVGKVLKSKNYFTPNLKRVLYGE